jgi:hypothetical protein
MEAYIYIIFFELIPNEYLSLLFHGLQHFNVLNKIMFNDFFLHIPWPNFKISFVS